MESEDAFNKHPRRFIPPPGPGRPSGAPNMLTKKGREAIVDFVVDNAGRMQQWLDDIASGYKTIAYDKHGNAVEKIVPPDPVKAAEIYQAMVEYYVPKLSRSTVAGDPDAPLNVNWKVEFVKKEPDAT